MAVDGEREIESDCFIDAAAEAFPPSIREQNGDAALAAVSAPIVLFVAPNPPGCMYCERLLSLFKEMQLPAESFVYLKAPKTNWQVDHTPARLRATLESLAGESSVPQLFIGGERVGGHDAAMASAKSGALTEKLRAALAPGKSEWLEALSSGGANGLGEKVASWPQSRVDWAKRGFLDGFFNGTNALSTHGGNTATGWAVCLMATAALYCLLAAGTEEGSNARLCTALPMLPGINFIQGVTRT